MNIFISAAISILETSGKEEFIKGINQWAAKQPDVVKRIIQSVYPVLDVEVANYVKTTKTKIDDRVVADLMEVCEAVAEENNFSLPNLDND